MHIDVTMFPSNCVILDKSTSAVIFPMCIEKTAYQKVCLCVCSFLSVFVEWCLINFNFTVLFSCFFGHCADIQICICMRYTVTTGLRLIITVLYNYYIHVYYRIPYSRKI